MARLHEYQAKALLRENGLSVPEGQAVTSANEARDVAERLGGPVVLKVQAWITGRAAKGGVQFADTPQQAEERATELLGMTFGNFPVREVLVEEAIDIQNEIFVSIAIDDEARSPVLLFRPGGLDGPLPEISGIRLMDSWERVLEVIEQEQGSDGAIRVRIYPCSPLQCLDAGGDCPGETGD